jgi:hypothetical protein
MRSPSLPSSAHLNALKKRAIFPVNSAPDGEFYMVSQNQEFLEQVGFTQVMLHGVRPLRPPLDQSRGFRVGCHSHYPTVEPRGRYAGL